jgi:thioesterase domain-containing protein
MVRRHRNSSEPRKEALMSPSELEHYLHEQIPLSKAMAVAVVSVTGDNVLLQAPLEPNINHHETVFGGSAAALALLAGWSLLHVRLRDDGIANRLVIQRHSMEFERPITGQFTARALLEQPDQWRRFTAMLTRRRKARVIVTCVLERAGEVVGTLRGEFVALGASAV